MAATSANSKSGRGEGVGFLLEGPRNQPHRGTSLSRKKPPGTLPLHIQWSLETPSMRCDTSLRGVFRTYCDGGGVSRTRWKCGSGWNLGRGTAVLTGGERDWKCRGTEGQRKREDGLRHKMQVQANRRFQAGAVEKQMGGAAEVARTTCHRIIRRRNVCKTDKTPSTYLGPR